MPEEKEQLPLYFESASVLARRIRRGEVSSVALVQLYISRIQELDTHEQVNAVVVRCFEDALERAEALDRMAVDGKWMGPLHGVPITVKENNHVRDLRTTVGDPTRKHDPPAVRNSPPCQRLIDAGAVILGKSNLPISCNDIQTYNAIWGSTSNPHDSSRTPGGSSGGSAASICAGFSALELGGDIGGSIRLPAALCGIFGHKSTLGSIPTRYGPSRAQDILVKGPLARSADDLKVAMEVLVHVAEENPRARAWKISLPPSKTKSLSEFRVAIWDDDACCPVDSDVKTVIEEFREALRVRKVVVQTDRPLREKYGWTGGSARAFEVYKALLASEESMGLDEKEVNTVRARLFARENEKEMTTMNKDEQRLHQQAKWITQSTQDWHRADAARQKMRTAYETFFKAYDVLICPIVCTAAWKKDESGSGPHEWTGANQRVRLSTDSEEFVQHFWQVGNRVVRGAGGHEIPYHDLVFWSGVTNICGNPSTVFPAGRAASREMKDLPIGLQIVGAEWNDLTTIAFAKALEKEAGFAFLPPKGY